MREVSPSQAALTVVVVGFVIRLIFAGTIGLGVDESYVVSVARSLELSYFDHPPLHFWIVWLTAHLTQSENGLILRFPFVLLFAGTSWMMYRLGAILFGEWAGFYAVLFLNISAVFSMSTGTWILPDGPLMFFVTAAAICLVRLFFEDTSANSRIWLQVGVLVGIGMLAKYHAVFLLAGSYLFMLTRRRTMLATSGPYLAAAVALLIFSPVILWNQAHQWISFVFQGNRGLAKGFYPAKMLGNIAGQAVWVLPWIWLPLIWAFGQGIHSGLFSKPVDEKNDKQWFLCCLAVGPIAILTVATLWGAQGLFHWQAPGYLFLFPLLGRLAANWLKEGRSVAYWWIRGSTVFFLLLFGVLASHTATGWLRLVEPQWFTQGDPTTEALDWHEIAGFLNEKGLLTSQVKFIAAPSWIDTGKLDYALGGRIPLLCLAKEPHHYAFLNNQAGFKGSDALIVGRKSVVEDTLNRYRLHFQQVTPVASFQLHRAGMPEMEVAVYYGSDFDGAFPLPYGP